MAIGIQTNYIIAADVPYTNSAALTTVGLTSPIAANQTQKIRAYVPINVGATGGVRCQVVVPAGGVAFLAGIKIVNTVLPLITPIAQVASAAATNALANAGEHWVEVEATIINGATAGNVDLQFAQNTADALTLTVHRGGFMEVIKL